jgi:DNA-binding MarR family transcriptional regulator
MLQRMERDGWISRERDSQDQRLVRVFITEKAKGLRKEARKVFHQMEEELNAVYTKEEQETLHRLLMKLHDRFAEEAGDDPHHHAFLGDDEGSEAAT